MWLLSLALRLALALSVALVSVHTAIGRAEASAASDIEFCIGTEIVTLAIDATGQPVKRNHTCPDCVLSGLAVLDVATGPLPPITSAWTLSPSATARSVTPAQMPHASARGPPALTQT